YEFVFISLYANLAEIFLKPNQLVKSNTLVGNFGNTMPFRKLNDLFIGIYTFNRSIFLRNLSEEKPIYLLGVYWWNPQKILKL
ncbi:MAG: hypothetical protein KAR07_10785, partial [Spirochaetes bacterium]|nr:hypothetical protein [Spirochaetota bacterium]